MRFYTRQQRHYCGIDLHARSLYLCILDQAGEKLVHQKLACDREQLLRVLRPYRKDLAVAVECLFCWYWVADLCAEEGIEFVLGHALFMKAIHGGKSKNDRIDSYKTPTRSPPCCAAEISPTPMSIPALNELHCWGGTFLGIDHGPEWPQRMILRHPLLQRNVAEHRPLAPVVSTHLFASPKHGNFTTWAGSFSAAC